MRLQRVRHGATSTHSLTHSLWKSVGRFLSDRTMELLYDPGNHSWEYIHPKYKSTNLKRCMHPKITADGEWSHEFQRRLLLGRKVMANLDSILKGRDITLPTKVRLVKAIVFSSGHVWMWVRRGRKLSAEELMLLNRGVGEDSWESLGLQGDPTSPFWRRSALGFLWKEWC